MGSGQSQNTRKLSVDNENAIRVSQDALDRIQGQLIAKQAEQPQPPQQYAPSPQFYESKNKQQEFGAEEAYWAKRINELKRNHEIINKSMHIEYQKTLQEANELFHLAQKHESTRKLPPCQEEKAKVLECYTSNPNTTLLCSVLVNQFNDCVCKSRVAAVTAS